jgi:hypothetical protein
VQFPQTHSVGHFCKTIWDYCRLRPSLLSSSLFLCSSFLLPFLSQVCRYCICAFVTRRLIVSPFDNILHFSLKKYPSPHFSYSKKNNFVFMQQWHKNYFNNYVPNLKAIYWLCPLPSLLQLWCNLTRFYFLLIAWH